MGKRRCLAVLVVLIGVLWPAVASAESPPPPVAEGDGPSAVDEGDEPTIVGGSVAPNGAYPHMVALMTPSGFQFCGGTLIAPQRVLTAAHCVDTATPSQVRIVAGTNVLNGSGQVRNVVRIHVHRGWNSGNNSNDLAALDLGAPVTIGSASPARVISQGQTSLWAPGTGATATGWGNTSEGGSPTSTLRQVNLPIQSNATCGSGIVYGSSFNGTTMLCAGPLAGGQDTCQGDSGGPLTVGSPATLVGITSWGIGCARPNRPGVYTRVAAYSNTNNAFGTPIGVPSGGGTAISRNYTATKASGEPNHAASNPGGASVWFRWTAPASGRVRISTLGSNFDTLLGVYRGSTMASLTRVASNDDYYGAQSRVEFNASRGVTYRIAVDGYSGDIGNVTLRVQRL